MALSKPLLKTKKIKALSASAAFLILAYFTIIAYSAETDDRYFFQGDLKNVLPPENTDLDTEEKSKEIINSSLESQPASKQIHPADSTREVKDGLAVYFGREKYRFYYSLGGSYQTNDHIFGTIGILRAKRTTNYTYNDVQIHMLYSPATAVSDEAFFGLFRYKRSYIMFDFPKVYEWVMYTFKSSTSEELKFRALLEYGYGGFLMNFRHKNIKIRSNYEAGIIFDYSNFDSFSTNVSAALVKNAFDIELEVMPFEAKLLIHHYYEVLNPNPELDANQTRLDLEGIGSYFFYKKNFYMTIGALYTRYLKLSQSHKQPIDALTVYSALTLRH